MIPVGTTLRGLATSTLALALSVPPCFAGDDVMDMSLEDLLESQLTMMGVGGIHHTHAQGEWMVGYRNMYMNMSGNRKGTRNLSAAETFAEGFSVTPTKMDMWMQMIGVMYAPTDRVSLMLMTPFVTKSMDHVTASGGQFTTRARGLGDVEVSALYDIQQDGPHRWVAQLGLSLPTGSVNAKDRNPLSGGVKVRLPYTMQLGTGTYDVSPAITYIGQTEDWYWGAHLSGRFAMNENRYDYSWGPKVSTTGWVSRRIAEWASASFRVRAAYWGDIHGADRAQNPAIVYTADPELRSGKRVDLLVGLNLFRMHGAFKGNRISAEWGQPIYQWLDGPQLETDWTFSLNWNATF